VDKSASRVSTQTFARAHKTSGNTHTHTHRNKHARSDDDDINNANDSRNRSVQSFQQQRTRIYVLSVFFGKSAISISNPRNERR